MKTLRELIQAYSAVDPSIKTFTFRVIDNENFSEPAINDEQVSFRSKTIKILDMLLTAVPDNEADMHWYSPVGYPMLFKDGKENTCVLIGFKVSVRQLS